MAFNATKLLSLLVLCFLPTRFSGAEEQLERGKSIYLANCASCHGEHGEGVEGAYEDPLVGDDSIGQLAAQIAKTMPEGEPEKCVGAEAEAVAAFVYERFYSEAAQIRNRPPAISFAHLTANQLRQSVADLYEQFEPRINLSDSGGVRGIYFDGGRWKNENKKLERTDAVIDFDFGRESPGEGINPEEFYIYWEGGIRADVSGRYEIVINSTCSFVMNFGQIGREFINNHTQSGDKTEFRKSVFLTAGRIYPFKIDFVQRKRKTEQPPVRIKLTWVPPGGIEHVIPSRNLTTQSAATFSLQTELPPDDRSYGFERGIAISREWDESTTAAALEFAQIAYDELWPNYLRRHRQDTGDDRAKMKSFLKTIVQTAFRSPLDDELVADYITRQLDAEVDDAEAIKRSLLISLKSPRFLYPLADATQSESQRVANRLTLTLFDSLPVERELIASIAQDDFKSADKVREFTRDHFNDTRLRAKTRAMLYEWLNVGQLPEPAKDEAIFPGFDRRLVSELRASFDAFLDQSAWGESGDYRQFFSADWAYTSSRIADYYGEYWQPADPLLTQALSKTKAVAGASQHFGLLSHPYLTSALAYHDATSPIHRGVFLIRYVLGRTLRPPADAFSPLSPDLHPSLTTRERVDLQTSPESCQVCHRKINGLGFALENFDAVGRYRTVEGEKPIDASGSYVARDDQQVEFADVQTLAKYLTGSDDARRAFVNRAFQYFVKQPAAAFGAETLDNLASQFEKSGCNIRELIAEIAVISAIRPM